MWLHHLLTCIVCMEKSAVLILILCICVCCFFWTAFKIFPLFLILSNLIVMCLGVRFFMFLVLGVCELFGSGGWEVSSNLEKFWSLFLKKFFSSPPFPLRFGYSLYMLIRPLEVASQLTDASFFTPVGFILVVSFAIPYINLSSVLTLPLIPSSVFFIAGSFGSFKIIFWVFTFWTYGIQLY